jgi:hypothetical protein
MDELGAFARQLLENAVIKGDSAALFDALTDEFKATLTISEISRRLAQMEQEHGMFTQVGAASPPTPNPAAEGFWIFDVAMYINQIEWFARVSINSEHKLNDFSFSRKPFYIAPDYFNPHKIQTLQLSKHPIVRLMQPKQRKTVKLPIGVFVHAVVHVDFDGHLGLRYPFRDLDFLAQHKIGLIRSSYENYGEPDPVISLARTSIELAMTVPINGGLFLILHSLAALFLPTILAIRREAVRGVVLVNPTWEAIPGSGLENMTAEHAQTGVPVLIIGSANDQILVEEHFRLWVKAIPEAQAEWLEKTDHFLMNADQIPDENAYLATPGHVNEKALRKIYGWIRSHWADS